MSLKKNIGVLVLLLVLLSMSAVSAEDVSINTNDTYQAPNEIQKDFTSLQTDIDNSQGAFELTYDVKHGDDEIDNYGISITKTTIINGNGHTIDANGHGSIFVVKDSSVTLTLNDLTLINANPVSDSSGIVSNGGAVYFDGSTLIVNNVNFKNNTVYKYGGAIYTTGTCIVDSSVFDGNDVQLRSQNIDNGGAAIYADNGASLLISNSQIINNHKNMVIRDNNVGDLVDGVVVATGYTKISKSYFRNNSGCYGGAVTSLGYTNAGKNQIIIENSVFDSNRAFQGAAVNVIGSTFKISGTNFTNNKGVGYGSGNPNVGALLTWYSCEGTISDCNFINNTADNGAAYRLGDDNKGVSSASVDSCTFINNTASNQGGAVYEGGTTGKATLDIKNSIFTNNSAKKEGSAIYSGYTLNIDDDTTFTNNMVYMYYTGTLNIGEIKTFTDLQKAINMVEGDIYLSSNVTMLASEADNFVNGIVVDHLVNLKCDGFTINANNLGRIFNVTSTADKLNIYNANLINGNADIGGAIYNTGSVYAFNTAFKDNTAATMGGAVFNKGTLTIQKCIVDNNDITKRTSSASEDYGGAAIYNWYDSTLFIKNSTISNNLKNYKNGDYVVGAVTSLGKTKISENSYFVNNSGRWGGAITTSGSSLPGKKVNELSISDSTFSKNGGLYGAGIFIEGSEFTITSCVFDSNTASGKGNMTPNDNNGAAIEVTNTDKAITGTISKTKFTNNKAQYGGAIDICAGTIKIINSKFINNSADVEGGAIDINAANGNPKVTISSSNFINNSAPVGGAICNVHDLTVKGSTFIDNTPNTIFNWVGAGGNLNLNIKTFTDLQNAIGLVTGTLTLNQNVAMTAKEAANFVNGVVINKNIAIDGKGHTIDAKNLGRIFSIGEGFTVTLTNATLINGKADKGGAIYNDGSLTLSDVKLSDNAADSYGGAVFNNGHLVVSDSVFDSNDIVNRGSASVDYGGAAIYNWYDGVLTVSGSNFTNNIKNYKNGDRLVGAVTTIGNATIRDSYFVNNSGRWGGALAATGGVSGSAINTISVDGTKFVNNTALYGGAMFVWASNYTISNSVFDNNSAFGKGDMSPNNNNGGALIVTQDNIPVSGKIVNSNFTNNKAQYGGAAWINEGTVDIDGSNFINNTATTAAGAIGFDPQYAKIIATVDSSKFVNNTAGSYAGAIYNLGDLTVSGSEFDNNKAQFGDIIYNNKIYNKEGILSINGNKYSNYTENKAPIINIGDINTISSTGGIIVTVLDNKTVNVCYGDVVTLHATVVADGVLVAGQKLFFVIDNVEYIANSLGNGSYIASYEVKDVGSKTVGIVYDGSDVNIKTGMLNISKATPDLTVGALNITVGDLEIITVTGPKDATGLITLTLNGIDYTLPIYNGEAKFYFQDLTADEYEVSASYSGDNHYVAAENSTVFKVDKVLANLKINVEDITFGENGLVIITLPSDIDGSVVTVNVNGKVYPVTVENGFAKLPLRELNAGDYTISAVFAGNDKYLPGVSNALLTVSKADPALNVFILDVDYYGAFNINVALTGVDAIGLNGDVIVTVNGKDYTVNVVNGKGNVTGVKLAAGTYDFTAKFAGSDNYNDVSDSGNFKVNKVDSAIDVAVSDIKVGEDAVITVKLFGDATGSVTVTVNGKDYTEPVVNGVVNVKVSGLKADTYDVAVKYSGDNNYNDAVATSSFTVSKVDPTMDVTADDIVFGEDLTVNAVLPADATGKVVIVVDGTSYTANITDGKATQVVKDLTAGYHTVGVKYGGDDKYNDVVVDGFVIVDKAQPVLGVVIADVNYGNEFAIEATLTGVNSTPLNGNVIVTVNGKFYVVNVTDGKGTLTGVKLAAGTYGFTAVWAGNDNYAAVDENGDFKVNKLNSTVAVNADDIKVGENVTVSVNVPSDATGNVIVTVDGKDYTVAIVDGKAVKTISDLKANNYTVTVKYDGDNNYNANQNTTKFTVSKISDYNMNITVPGDVKVGEDAVIIVNVPKDASGNVTVSVGKDVYNAVISNGSAKVVVSGLGAGVYNVSANFTDDKYAQNKANATVVVSKVTDYNMNITVPEFKEGVNSTISVDLPKDATGTVTVEIDGKKYTANVTNGTAKVNIPALSAGNHNITTTYSGDAKYDSMTKKGNITVIPNVNLDVNDVVMFYHDGTRLVAKLTDSQGKPIVNATIYFNINGVDYVKSTDDNGTASMGLNLDSNVYAVTVTYNGSDIYSKISKNVTVTINPSIIAKDLVKMYQNDTKFYAKFIGSDGKALVNTTVRFNIHGVFYNRTTNDDGIAELGIMLRPGNYILTAYNPVTGEEQGFNITVKSLIVQNDLTKYYLNASKFEATIYDKNGSLAVNKTVTFNIHGVFYTRSTDDKGVVSLGISLRPGEYIITTIYEGLAVGNNITVLPTLVTRDLNMTHEDGSNFTAQTLDGQGKPLANQNVTFNINGVFYNKVTDENGVASLAMRLMSGKYIITSYWNDFQTGNTIIIS
ncbi:MAG: Ig-like domain repeat protein [Methanobrevibacter smithii]